MPYVTVNYHNRSLILLNGTKFHILSAQKYNRLFLHLPPMTPNCQCGYFMRKMKDGKMRKSQYNLLHYNKENHNLWAILFQYNILKGVNHE